MKILNSYNNPSYHNPECFPLDRKLFLDSIHLYMLSSFRSHFLDHNSQYHQEYHIALHILLRCMIHYRMKVKSR